MCTHAWFTTHHLDKTTSGTLTLLVTILKLKMFFTAAATEKQAQNVPNYNQFTHFTKRLFFLSKENASDFILSIKIAVSHCVKKDHTTVRNTLNTSNDFSNYDRGCEISHIYCYSIGLF